MTNNTTADEDAAIREINRAIDNLNAAVDEFAVADENPQMFDDDATDDGAATIAARWTEFRAAVREACEAFPVIRVEWDDGRPVQAYFTESYPDGRVVLPSQRWRRE